ncbi:MAG: DJ-1/PfpI family protein [Candidatus Nanoarchaeia archaeon]|nr:DJ-1/PfpI family protein [Candidatus Nanoarchaeia archaeon]
MVRVLEIIAPKGFQELEYSIPKQIFLDNKIKVITASTEKIALSHMGNEQIVDLNIFEVKVEDYDVVVFIGGGGALVYQNNEFALNICKEAVKQNKLLCAICIAPIILAQSGVLKGKNATVWNGNGEPAKILEKFGAIFIDEEVTIDGNIITANGPQSAEKFAKTILKTILL